MATNGNGNGNGKYTASRQNDDVDMLDDVMEIELPDFEDVFDPSKPPPRLPSLTPTAPPDYLV